MQPLVNSVGDALSSIFMLLIPRRPALDSPAWVLGRHASLLKMTKYAILANCDDTYDIYRLVDDLFIELQGRSTSGFTCPAAFKILLFELVDYFV